MEEVSFTRMDQGTLEDYLLIDEKCKEAAGEVPDFLLQTLKSMHGSTLGFKIDRYEHSLQTATMALRDGADEETVVCALLHDVGDVLAPANHSQVAAAILRPYISDQSYWVVAHHGLFQGYYYQHFYDRDRNERDRFSDHPHYQACADFCEKWDQRAFDPDYDTLPLEEFEPMVYRLFENTRSDFM